MTTNDSDGTFTERARLVEQYLERWHANAAREATRAGATMEEPLARRAHELSTILAVVRGILGGEVDKLAEPVTTADELLAQVLPPQAPQVVARPLTAAGPPGASWAPPSALGMMLASRTWSLLRIAKPDHFHADYQITDSGGLGVALLRVQDNALGHSVAALLGAARDVALAACELDQSPESLAKVREALGAAGLFTANVSIPPEARTMRAEIAHQQ